jgi:hypothetical protein|tara:strand:- start:65 stop:334 length:270 start_codon:yes stop_codon:yes gene_type:complete
MRPIKRDYRMRVAKKRQRQGYDVYDPETKHYSTVDPKTGKFLKSSDHPTVNMEIDWYNSPEGADFKKEYKLVTHRPSGRKRRFYKYVKR